MKKLLLFMSIIIFMNSCIEETKSNQSNPVIGDYTIIEIDGCEYIVAHPLRSDNSITHKGNCKKAVKILKNNMYMILVLQKQYTS